MFAFFAFLVAALFFFLSLIEASFGSPHQVDAGLLALAIGLALPYVESRLGRNPR